MMMMMLMPYEGSRGQLREMYSVVRTHFSFSVRFCDGPGLHLGTAQTQP